MDAAALERVLDAMAAKDVPIKLDKRALREDLAWAKTMLQTTSELDSPSLAKRRFRRVRDMQVTAKKLATLLKANDDDACLLRRFYPPSEPDPTAVLERMIKAADRAMENRREFVKGGKPVPVFRLSGNPFVRLIGNELSEIFKKHFGQEAGYTRDNYDDIRPIKGAFIDFAEAVLKEFGYSRARGKPYSRAGIADALTEWRSGKPRRKG